MNYKITIKYTEKNEEKQYEKTLRREEMIELIGPEVRLDDMTDADLESHLAGYALDDTKHFGFLTQNDNDIEIDEVWCKSYRT